MLNRISNPKSSNSEIPKSPNSPTPEVIAAFDFDGTITTTDSLKYFLHDILSIKFFLFTLIRSLPTLLAFKTGFMHNEQAKVRVLRRVIGGWTQEKLDALGKQFAETTLMKLVKPEALRKIEWHKSQGHTLVLVSASIETYLKPWCEAMGFQYCCGSRLEFIEGKATGNLVGKNCWGAEKVARLEAIFGNLAQYELYAYGDTRGDREMLATAQHKFYRYY